MFAELPAEVQSQARRAYRVFSRIRTNRVFVSSLFILHGPFILFGSVPVTEQWEISWKATKSSGTGSARMRTMINFFHNRGADPNPWVEKDAERRALTKMLEAASFRTRAVVKHEGDSHAE
jgi:hypothetical protein